MELEELDSLSKKASDIVRVLGKLEEEAKSQANATQDIQKERQLQQGLTSSLESAAKELYDAARILSAGSLSVELKSFDEKLSELDERNLDGMRLLDSLGNSQSGISEQAASLADAAQSLAGSTKQLQSATEEWIAQNAENAQTLAKASSKSEASVVELSRLTGVNAEQIAEIAAQCEVVLQKASDMSLTADALDQHVSALHADLESAQRRMDRLEAELGQAVEASKANAEKLDRLIEVVSRVDRNTQKGFGKERG